MTYCDPSDVRTIVNTTLTDDEIEFIEMSDADIDRRIGKQSS